MTDELEAEDALLDGPAGEEDERPARNRVAAASETRPWLKRDDENKTQFQSFLFYKKLAPVQRTYSRVSKQIGVSTVSIQNWADRFDWAFRVKSWDDHVDGRDTVKERQVLGVERARLVRMGRKMTRFADQVLQQVTKAMRYDKEKNGRLSLTPDELDLITKVKSLAREGSQLIERAEKMAPESSSGPCAECRKREEARGEENGGRKLSRLDEAIHGADDREIEELARFLEGGSSEGAQAGAAGQASS